MVKQFNYAALLPRCSYKDFLLGLQNMLNIVFRFRNDGKVDIIDRNEILSSAAIDLTGYRVGDWTMGERKNLKLKFIPEFDKNDGNFSSNFEDLSDRAADYGEAVDTYNDLLAIASPAAGELHRVKDTNKIYEYKWKVVVQEDQFLNETQYDALGWEFVSSGPQPYVFGTADEEEEIKSVFSALQQFSAGPAWIPIVNQKGTLQFMKNLYEDFSPRLLASNPLAVGSQNDLYFEDNGLFATRWRKWAQFWATRQPVEATFQLSMNMIAYITDNIYSKFRTAEGEFIIEEMETEFSLDSIGVTRIRGYKI